MEEKNHSRYLVNEDPIFFLPSLAKAIGLNEAILLQKIHGWLNLKPKSSDGRSWIYNTYKSWQEQLPFMSEITIKRTMKSLVDKKLVIIGNFNKEKYDKTNWYSINYENVENISKTIENTHSIKMIPSIVSNCTNREYQNDTTNTNNNNNNNNNNKKEILKNKYGALNNVNLTDEEYTKLQENNLLSYIDTLSYYLESTGKKYKSHYATILAWNRKEQNKAFNQTAKKTTHDIILEQEREIERILKEREMNERETS